jgi:hypothetical protein
MRWRCPSSIAKKRAKNLSAGGRRFTARKSISWISRRVRPPLAARTASTSARSPGTKRSSPTRSSGPDGTSRIPVASTTSAPGRPAAKRAYQSITSPVTSPSALARHGTIAGTQVRCSNRNGPHEIGENHRLRAASSAEGQRATATA